MRAIYRESNRHSIQRVCVPAGWMDRWMSRCTCTVKHTCYLSMHATHMTPSNHHQCQSTCSCESVRSLNTTRPRRNPSHCSCSRRQMMRSSKYWYTYMTIQAERHQSSTHRQALFICFRMEMPELTLTDRRPNHINKSSHSVLTNLPTANIIPLKRPCCTSMPLDYGSCVCLGSVIFLLRSLPYYTLFFFSSQLRLKYHPSPDRSATNFLLDVCKTKTDFLIIGLKKATFWTETLHCTHSASKLVFILTSILKPQYHCCLYRPLQTRLL